MSNRTELLPIEKAALQAIGINLSEIRNAETAVNSAAKSKFDNSIAFGRIAARQLSLFSARGSQAALQRDGIDSMRTVAEFMNKVFSFQPSWVYKAMKAAKNIDENTELYAKYMRHVEAGEIAHDVVAWNKFVKDNGELPADEEGEGDDSSSSKTTIASFSIAKIAFADEKGVSVRVLADGTLSISGDAEKIPASIMEGLVTLSQNIADAIANS